MSTIEDRNMTTLGNAAVKRKTASLQFAPLDKNSFTPMYAQIQAQLLEMIRTGQLQPGDLLPSEEELSRIHGISRMTARQALQSLKNQGFAMRQKGKGTFVTRPKMEKDIAHLFGFTAEMHSLGMKPSSRVLAAETITATDEIAARLAINKDDPIFRLRRLRLANNLPLAIEEICLPITNFPGIQKIDFSKHSLYQIMHERYGIHFGVADEILEAHAAGRHEAELLEIQPRSSLLVISRILWSIEGKPIETASSSYRGDRYRAVLRIPATTAG
jgi:GntR family transcriptional regulator